MTDASACRTLSTYIALVPWLVPAAACADVHELMPGDSIQAVIDDPATMDGDEIVLAPGTYVGTVDFDGRALTLRSVDPNDPAVVAATVLDGGGADSVVVCVFDEGPDTIIDGLTVTGGVGFSGGGFLFDGASPTVRRCTIAGNHALFEGGGAFCFDSDARFVNCRFLGNSAMFGGGASCIVASPTFVNCMFSGNVADTSGGAIDVLSGGLPRLANCVLSNNQAATGGGLANDGGLPELASTILWANAGGEVSDATASTTFTHCNVAGAGGSAGWDDAFGLDGGGNVDVDPTFVDALGPDGVAGTMDDDVRLAPGSPCLDAGSNDELGSDFADLDGDGDTAELLPLDLDGNPRRADRANAPDTGTGDAPLVDMGPYELESDASECTWDLDADGWVGPRDFMMVVRCLGRRGRRCCDVRYDIADLIDLLNAWGPCDGEDDRRRRWRWTWRRCRR